MFVDAKKFNQDLCAWRYDFPYGDWKSKDIFLNSGCTIQDPPRRLLLGPFCASKCDPIEKEYTGGDLVIDGGPGGPVLPGDEQFTSSASRIKLDSVLLAATAVTFTLVFSM